MRVYLGSDHAGYELKRHLLSVLPTLGYEVEDVGPTTYDPADDYPPFCLHTAARVVADPGCLGIVIGGSGNGEQIAANKVPGVRAALAWSVETARLAREHNDANLVAIGARMHPTEQATEIVATFLGTPFPGANGTGAGWPRSPRTRPTARCRSYRSPRDPRPVADVSRGRGDRVTDGRGDGVTGGRGDCSTRGPWRRRDRRPVVAASARCHPPCRAPRRAAPPGPNPRAGGLPARRDTSGTRRVCPLISYSGGRLLGRRDGSTAMVPRGRGARRASGLPGPGPGSAATPAAAGRHRPICR